MASNGVKGDLRVERRIIRISGKRQVTIPLHYFESLGFGSEAECILQADAVIIRPFRQASGSDLAEQILADLVSQGFSGQELLAKFREMSQAVAPAMSMLISEADSIVRGERTGAALDELFRQED